MIDQSSDISPNSSMFMDAMNMYKNSSRTLDEKRFKELSERISKKYDSQVDGCHIISEKS